LLTKIILEEFYVYRQKRRIADAYTGTG